MFGVILQAKQHEQHECGGTSLSNTMAGFLQ
jgi:hypothetical protein